MQKIKVFFLRRLRVAIFLTKNPLKFEYDAQKTLQASFFACIITQSGRKINIPPA